MKRKCGTCKYFEDRGVANSGVCQHAQRRELRDVVLVRQSELACRNSWDQDLWEPGVDDRQEVEPADGIMTDEVISDSVSAPRKRDKIFGGSEDVPILPPYDYDLDRVTGFGFGRYENDNRPSTQTAGMVQEGSDSSWNVRPSVLESLKQREEERRLQRQAQQKQHLQAIEATMKSADAIGPDMAVVQGRHSDNSPRGSGAEHPPREGSPIRPPSQSAGQGLSSRLEGSVRIDPPDVAPGHQPTEQLPTEELRRSLGESRPFPGADAPMIHVDGRVTGNRPSAQEQRSAPKVAQPEPRDPIDQNDRLQAIRRCCGTCRDFRQVGDSGRGQCVNPYAFSERRMVQSDQLACRSSLGMWWMPNDDVWLESADTSHHGRPTPLLDAAMRAERASAGESGRDSRQ